MAERLLQAGLNQAVPGGFVVASAGTRAMVGEPMQPFSADIVRTFGGDPDNFAARQLTPAILRGVDLVLTMTTGHRGDVLQLDASLLKRTTWRPPVAWRNSRSGAAAAASTAIRVASRRA